MDPSASMGVPSSTTGVECPDCSAVFPLRQGGGPCPKCVKLAPHPRNSEAYGDITVRPNSFESSLDN